MRVFAGICGVFCFLFTIFLPLLMQFLAHAEIKWLMERDGRMLGIGAVITAVGIGFGSFACGLALMGIATTEEKK